MIANILIMPAKTYRAKLFEVPWEGRSFKIAGTLEGSIDLATPNGTYLLSLTDAQCLAKCLEGGVSDVKENCLYDRDALLEGK